MSTFLDRLIEEKEQLDGRIDRLESFLDRVNDDSEVSIDPTQISLLKVQLTAMKTYLTCLVERLWRLSEPISTDIVEFTTTEGDTYEQASPTLYTKVN